MMKFYNNIYEMPVWNLIEIQRSINDGNPKYHFMIVGSEEKSFKIPKTFNKDEAKEAHDVILFQMPETDNLLMKSWAVYLGEVRRVQIYKEWNKNAYMLKKIGVDDPNFKPKKINHNKTNQAFGSYLNEFERRHTEFEFMMYGITKKAKEEWKKYYPNLDFPKVLKDKPELKFYLFEEYLDLLTDYEKEHGGVVDEVLKSEIFIKVFIEPEKMKFGKLRGIEKRMNKFFISINQADKWKAIRGDFFGLGRVKCKPKSDNTMLDEVIILSDVMNQDINLKETTVGKLQRIKIQAKEKVKQSNKSNEKPNASG